MVKASRHKLLTHKVLHPIYLIIVLSTLVCPGITEGFSGAGSGTEQDPYIITDVDQLQEMDQNLGAWYELGNDINASDTENWNGGEGFAPIGRFSYPLYDEPFTGNFDGKEYKITSLFIKRNTNYVGLFGYTYASAVIKNVTLEDVNISGGEKYTGGLVGRNWADVSNSRTTGDIRGHHRVGGLIGENFGDSDIEGSSSTVDLTSTGGAVGGLVGLYAYGSISNSYATGNVTGDEDVGGLVGYNHDGSIINSYATRNVTGNNYVGGLVGFNDGGSISNSYATGKVTATVDNSGGLAGYTNGKIEDSYATGNVTGNNGVGGLSGGNRSRVYGISNSYATGNVTGTGDNIGGLVGSNPGKIEDSYATGNVTGDEDVGGLVGRNDYVIAGEYSLVERSYATGNVTGNYNIGGLIGRNRHYSDVNNSYAIGDITGYNYVGGLVGYDYGHIFNSYAVGNVTGTGYYVGGLVGYSSICPDCFWDINTSDQNTSACGTGKTTAEMKQQATFTNWDFDDVWGIIEDVTYPFLREIAQPVLATEVSQRARQDVITAAESWSDTGLDVLQKQVVNIMATGSVYVPPDLEVGPSGNKYLDPDATGPYGLPQYALIAKIGDSAPFYVGAHGIHMADNDGRLYLRINDTHSTGQYGSVTAQIKLEDVTIETQKAVDAVSVLHSAAMVINDFFLGYGPATSIIINPCILDPSLCVGGHAFMDRYTLVMLNSPGDLIVQDHCGHIIQKDAITNLGYTFYLEGDILGDGHTRDIVVFANPDSTDIGDYAITVVAEAGADPNEFFSVIYFDRHISQIYSVIDSQSIGAGPFLYPITIVPKPITGDLYDDRGVDFSDYAIFASHWMGVNCSASDFCDGADLDFTSTVDFADLAIFSENWLKGKIPADFNIDGDVDFADLLILTRYWLENEPTLDIAPPVGDGIVNFKDFALLADHWLEGTTP